MTTTNKEKTMSKTKLPPIDVPGFAADQDIKIDRTNLDEEFTTHAELYWFYARMAEEAKAVAETKKIVLEQVYAQTDSRKRQEALLLQAKNPKWKYTEKMCEGEVKTDPKYREAQKIYQDAKLRAGQLDAAAKAFIHRKDMLVQLGASNRAGTPLRALDK